MADDFATGYALGADASNGNGGSGFGNWGDSWVLIILFALIFGWGNGGGGFIGGGGRGGAADNYVLSSDFAMAERKLDGIANGLCDGFYTQAQLVNGVQANIAAQGYQNGQLANSLENAIQGATNQLVTGQTAIQTQMAQCCCENKQAIADLKYTMATDSCATRQAITDASRDIIDNQNANYRSLMDYFVQDRMAALQAENQSLRLAQSQAAQNQYLISALRPTPVPAFSVPAPWQYGSGGCGCC